MRAVLAALVAVALGSAAPAGARSDPPKHPAAAAHQLAKQRAARKRAVARHRAAVRRREAARRKALAEAQAPPPVVVPALPAAPALEVPSDEPVAPAAPDVPAAPAVPLARTVGITEREFSLSLSRTTVGAGDVTVQVLNRGEDAHDLRIETLGGGLLWFFPEIPPLGSTEPTVVPLTVGTYRIFCTLPGHAELGMDKRLTVAAG
jgi:plastocyanin